MSAVLSTEDVQQLIGGGETLRVEFKGDRRSPLSDHHVYSRPSERNLEKAAEKPEII